MKNENCVFCKIARGIIPIEKIDESENFLAFPDKNQNIKGHTLIIPKRHFTNLLDIPDKLGNELLKFTKKISHKILNTKTGDGFNILMNNLPPAGQVILHAHIHILPRKDGDNVKTIF